MEHGSLDEDGSKKDIANKCHALSPWCEKVDLLIQVWKYVTCNNCAEFEKRSLDKRFREQLLSPERENEWDELNAGENWSTYDEKLLSNDAKYMKYHEFFGDVGKDFVNLLDCPLKAEACRDLILNRAGVLPTVAAHPWIWPPPAENTEGPNPDEEGWGSRYRRLVYVWKAFVLKELPVIMEAFAEGSLFQGDFAMKNIPREERKRISSEVQEWYWRGEVPINFHDIFSDCAMEILKRFVDFAEWPVYRKTILDAIGAPKDANERNSIWPDDKISIDHSDSGGKFHMKLSWEDF